MKINKSFFKYKSKIHFCGSPEGVDILAVLNMSSILPSRPILYVTTGDKRLAIAWDTLKAFAPDITVLDFPAWDCLPYDRVSPNPELTGRRLNTLFKLNHRLENNAQTQVIILTTVNAILQKVPSRNQFKNSIFELKERQNINLESLSRFLSDNGYRRTGTVREAGEFAYRGGIIDIFPSGAAMPVRLDLFGNEIEEIRRFDPLDQRSLDSVNSIALQPVREYLLDKNSISRFRKGYREKFGNITNDPLYEAVSEGKAMAGIEHWVPIINEDMASLLDYLPNAVLAFENQCQTAISARHELINDFYEARQSFFNVSGPSKKEADRSQIYRPLPPNYLYFMESAWEKLLQKFSSCWFTPFKVPEPIKSIEYDHVIDLGGALGYEFSSIRQSQNNLNKNNEHSISLLESVLKYVKDEQVKGQKIAIACHTTGSRERVVTLLKEHRGSDFVYLENWSEFLALSSGSIGLFVLGLERGFRSENTTLISEQDIFGERIVQTKKKRRSDTFLTDTSELVIGDFVVHIEHGIGSYEGLETVNAGDAPHDCLRISYADGDKLFVPVENIEILSRYGSTDSGAVKDKLGGSGWQARKARVKKRLEKMAEKLISIAAERTLQSGRKLVAEDTMYEEFCAKFPYSETEDQMGAIDDTVADLAGDKPMDRLICGDVGFGKTEIALRASFAAVMAGGQVAIVAPTTLLARQHYQTFCERFHGYPVKIAQLSRMVSAKEAKDIKEGLENNSVDIVIGTHALLGKSIKFKDLALLVIDEEQRFGVSHKERLKEIRSNVHVLTLTATPIPRTLQLALSGVKEMSIIASPPIDRLAVRTFILPFDPLIVREAILRERFRGGQIFYVCPRIVDMEGVENQLRQLVPDLKIAIAHGQMKSSALESIMTEFYDGKSDLLISTQIVESGLDIPSANTLFVHRADRFGLAQLYQLRGRIGRSKQRAYCYLTIPAEGNLTETASKRLEVMQSLDSLGAGFKLASHDLDIRGAGNLLGDEQSGHIREVGVELYQNMLEDAVANARLGKPNSEEKSWSPQINIGSPVLIPENYVKDLDARLNLYRRLANLNDTNEVEGFAAELIDRFGKLPEEVDNLLEVVKIKQMCKKSGISKLEAGPKGLVITFYKDNFSNPAGLINLIQEEPGRIVLRPDHRLIMRNDWKREKTKLRGTKNFVYRILELAIPA